MRTADTGTLSVDWGTASLYVHLITHSSTSEGFRAHYTAHRYTFCSGIRVFSSATGNIEDGSGDHDYNNLTTCKYRIVLGAYSAIHVDINMLDLEEGKDFLYFYDNTMSDGHHLLTLTGNMSNTSYTFETRRLLMVLETDETGTAGGFSIDYEGGQVGVEELSRQELSLYPNPAKDRLHLSYSTPIQQVDILNAEGELLHRETPSSENVSLQVGHLPAGIYMVRITTEEQVFTKKFIKLQ